MINRLLLLLIGVSTFYYFISPTKEVKTEENSKHKIKHLSDLHYSRKLTVTIKSIFNSEMLDSDIQNFEGPYLSSTEHVLYWASNSKGVMKHNLTSEVISVLVPGDMEDDFVAHSVVFDEKETFYMTSEMFNNKGSIFKYDLKSSRLTNLLKDNKNGLDLLNSPNDLVLVSSDTSEKIFFTDPFWFSREIKSILENFTFSAILGLWKRKSALYSYDIKTNEIELVHDFGSLFAQPNGLAVDKEQKQMFVSLTGKTQVVVFDILEDAVRYKYTFDMKNNYPASGNLRPPMFLDGMTVHNDYLLIAPCQDFILVKSISTSESEKYDFIIDLSSTGIERATNLVYDEFDDVLYVTDGSGFERDSRIWKVDISGALSNVFL